MGEVVRWLSSTQHVWLAVRQVVRGSTQGRNTLQVTEGVRLWQQLPPI